MKRFFVLVAFLVCSVTFAQTPTPDLPPTYLGEGGEAKLIFTVPTLNEDGTPLTDLTGYTLAISTPLNDMNAGGTPMDIDPTSNGDFVHYDVAAIIPGADPGTGVLRIEEHFNGLPGGLYRVWLRAYDDNGNESSIWGASRQLVDWESRAPQMDPLFIIETKAVQTAASWTYSEDGQYAVKTVVWQETTMYRKEEEG